MNRPCVCAYARHIDGYGIATEADGTAMLENTQGKLDSSMWQQSNPINLSLGRGPRAHLPGKTNAVFACVKERGTDTGTHSKS